MSHIAPFFGQGDHLRALNADGLYIETEHGLLKDFNGGGYWTVPLGHRNHQLVSSADLGTWADLFNYETGACEAYAQALAGLVPFQKLLFGCSGSSVADAALRMVFQIARQENRQGSRILTLKRSYHGSTGLTLACSGLNYKKWTPGADKLAFVWDDEAALRRHGGDIEAALNEIPWEDICGFIFEPVRAVGGLRQVNFELLEALLEQCQQAGVVTVADEITTGVFRCGELAWSSRCGVLPDIVLLGKAITNGIFPLAVALISRSTWDRLDNSSTPVRDRYQWGETYAGHPSAVAVANRVLGYLSDPGIHVNRKSLLSILQERTPPLRSNRGVADVLLPADMLAVGIKFRNPKNAYVLERMMRERGYRLGVESNVLLVVPMFVSREMDLHDLIDGLAASLAVLDEKEVE